MRLECGLEYAIEGGHPPERRPRLKRLERWPSEHNEANVELRILGIAGASLLGLFLGTLWATGGTQRERALLTGAAPDVVRDCEAAAAARPDDPEAARALAQAYLDAQQPGLALSILEGPGALARDADARTGHLYARALLDQGRNGEALEAESSVVASCEPVAEGAPGPRGCDALLLAAAVRRASILRELVALGVEDTRAYPEMSYVAYQNATREARVTMR
jgi:hypothetical protein